MKNYFLQILKKILVLFKKNISKTDKIELYSRSKLTQHWINNEKNYRRLCSSFKP